MRMTLRIAVLVALVVVLALAALWLFGLYGTPSVSAGR